MYRRDWRLFLMEISESINKIEKYTILRIYLE